MIVADAGKGKLIASTCIKKVCIADLVIIIDNFCTVLFSGVHKLIALYYILQHCLS